MRRSICLVLCLLLLMGMGTGAAASGALRVDGRAIEGDVAPRVVGSTTYVSLRTVIEALRSDANVTWEGKAVARAAGVEVTACPGDLYLEANGRILYVRGGILAEAGRILVPVRVLAQALDAAVEWDPATGAINIKTGSGAITPSGSFYGADDLYWLARIISAESSGEPIQGKIAVGNVVRNRVKSREFPNSIYGVIFDNRWGGQFEPVRNGTIYQEPTPESTLAAKLCLEGVNVVGESLYFLAPALTNNHWIMQNRPYVTTIGAHWFYR